jgi:hypothetical protein
LDLSTGALTLDNAYILKLIRLFDRVEGRFFFVIGMVESSGILRVLPIGALKWDGKISI